MSKDEEYVRSVWEWVSGLWSRSISQPTFCLALKVIWRGALAIGYFKTEEEAWSAAAAFTRTRLEQVRQLREEIYFVCEADYSGADGEVTEQAAAAQKRTIARLESALATLTRGMKPEVLEGVTR